MTFRLSELFANSANFSPVQIRSFSREKGNKQSAGNWITDNIDFDQQLTEKGQIITCNFINSLFDISHWNTEYDFPAKLGEWSSHFKCVHKVTLGTIL